MQTNVDANPGTISSYLSLIAASACWGLATVMSKGSLEHFPPFTLLTVQLFGSTLFLWFMFFAFGMGNPLAHFKLRAAAAGLLEPGLAYALAIPGLALTSAANTSIIGASESLLIILIAWLLFMQRPSVPVIAASALALAGVLFVTMSDTSGLGQGRVLGDALVFGGMVVAALYVVLSSRLVGDVAPLPLAAQQQTVALVFAVGLALFVVLNG